jgi:hypothetical protein
MMNEADKERSRCALADHITRSLKHYASHDVIRTHVQASVLGVAPDQQAATLQQAYGVEAVWAAQQYLKPPPAIEEIAEQIRKGMRGEVPISYLEGPWGEEWHGEIPFLFGDWRIVFYNDGDEAIDYCDSAVAPDGRLAGDWPGDTDPWHVVLKTAFITDAWLSKYQLLLRLLKSAKEHASHSFDSVPFQNAHAMDEDSGAGPDAHTHSYLPQPVLKPLPYTAEETALILAAMRRWSAPITISLGVTLGRLPDAPA